MSRSRARERGVKRGSRGLRIGGGALVVGLAAALVATEVRHRRALAADPDYSLLSSPLAGSEVRAVSADGTVLHAEVFGPDDGATVVLVPGWTEKLQIWDLVTRGLVARGFRVVSFDLRGQGESGAPAGGDQSIPRYGEDVEAVLAATCEGRSDVVVAGHSMGGMSIMAWAEAFDASARVRGAALVNTGGADLVEVSRILPHSLPLDVRRSLGERFILGGPPPPPVSTPLSRAALRYIAFGPTASVGQIDFYERMGWAVPAKVRIAAGTTLGTLDVLSGARRLNVPTLVIAGDMDRLTPAALAQTLVELLPSVAEFKLLSATGHMSLLERPGEVVDALARLASGVASEAPKAAPAAAG